jgi:hypothetical protein
MIHLRRATERVPLIQALEASINTPLEVRDAIDGNHLITRGHPTECGIHPGINRTAGEIGCAASHLDAYERALASDISHLVVFEDDCALAPGFDLGAISNYLRRAKHFAGQFGLERMDEFLLLSTCGCYNWRPLTRGVKVTDHFNGSHAYIIGRPMMKKVVAFYKDLAAQKKTAPIDGVLPILLRQERRWAFCPEQDTHFFEQNRAIPSYTVSDGTETRKD